MKLSKAQIRALEKFKDGKPHSAYDVQESLSTLYSLKNKGLLLRSKDSSYGFSPSTGIKFLIK